MQLFHSIMQSCGKQNPKNTSVGLKNHKLQLDKKHTQLQLMSSDPTQQLPSATNTLTHRTIRPINNRVGEMTAHISQNNHQRPHMSTICALISSQHDVHKTMWLPWQPQLIKPVNEAPQIKFLVQKWYKCVWCFFVNVGSEMQSEH